MADAESSSPASASSSALHSRDYYQRLSAHVLPTPVSPTARTHPIASATPEGTDIEAADDVFQLSPIRNAHTKYDHRQRVDDDYIEHGYAPVMPSSPQLHHHSHNFNHQFRQHTHHTTAPNSTATSPTVAESHMTRQSLLTTTTTDHRTPTTISHPGSPFPYPPRPSYNHTAFLNSLHSAALQNPGRHYFAFSPVQLRLLATARSLQALYALGGLKGLANGLWADLTTGLSVDELAPAGRVEFQEAVAAAEEKRNVHALEIEGGRMNEKGKVSFWARKEMYGGGNGRMSPKVGGRAFLGILWRRVNDKLVIMLLISAILVLILAAVQAKGTTRKKDKKDKKEWAQGTAAVAAIVVVVLSCALTEWEMSRRFSAVDSSKTESFVRVVRSGRTMIIPAKELLVGDLVSIQTGDVMPADGVVVTADGILMDEYSITGEARVVVKQPPPEDFGSTTSGTHADHDPFIVCGTVVLEGSGCYLVTVLNKTTTQSSFNRYPVMETPLQSSLSLLAKQLATWGALAGVLYFTILLIRYIIQTAHSSKPPIEKAHDFFSVIVNVSTTLLVAVPSNFVFSVLVALAFATSRMFRQGNLVKKMDAIEIMGDVTCINTGKSGCLTFDDPCLAVGRVGHGEQCDLADMITRNLGVEARQVIRNAILVNTTAFETTNVKSNRTFNGPSTEVALLKFAVDHLGLANLQEERAGFNIVKTFVFDPALMLSITIVKLQENKLRLFVVGAAESVLSHSESIIEDCTCTSVTSATLTLEMFESLDASIHNYGRKMLRPLAIAYRDLWDFDIPLDSITPADVLNSLVFVALFGLYDPLRPEISPLVRQCHQAGVFVRLVTGDNFSLARAVASKCGIFTPGGIVMDGPTFRSLSHWQLDLVVPRLQVLTRATPDDELLLVTHLRGMGETVAAVGSSLNDSLAIKAADVGFALGSGTDAVRESADVVMVKEGFLSLVGALGWGRTVSDSVKKFIQFQLTINITAGIITIISTLVGTLILNIPQLLWVNLIATVFGIVALTTDYPSADLMARRPQLKKQPIITLSMWKMILCQALYQTLSILTIHYVGWAIFEPKDSDEISDLQTLVFNIYIWMQIFNQHNCRRVDNNINVHHQGLIKSPWFLLSQVLIIIGQVVIVTQGGAAFNTKQLNGYQWAWSILFGFLTLPLGILIRQIPDNLVFCIFQILLRAYNSLRRSFVSIMPGGLRHHALDTPSSGPHQPKPWVLATGTCLLTPISYRLCRHEEAPKETVDDCRPTVMSAPLQRARRQLQERILRQKGSNEGVDLYGIVGYVREALNPVESGLDIHPETGLNDPVLMKTIGVDGASDPPSQDPEIIKMLSLRTKK